jgi:anti-sigma factor RsiW
MTHLHDPISETDFLAYVDDALEAPRRIEVEAYLAAHPDDAALVMADLRIRDELRLAITDASQLADLATAAAASRLERGLARGRFLGVFQRAVIVGLLVASGWLAHEAVGPLSVSEVVASTPPPAYVEDAVQAHRTTMLRAAMISQPETSAYDPVEIRAATAIVMPGLSQDWRVLDVQIYPSKFGPSVEAVFNSEEFGMLSLYAVRPGDFDVVAPTMASPGEVTAAYFQVGEVAYALVAGPGAHDLDRAAARLADSLR